MSCWDSVSPTSEPPHIDKWFSSYEYESSQESREGAVGNIGSQDTPVKKLRSFDNGRCVKRSKDSDELGWSIKRKIFQTSSRNSSSENQENVDSLSVPSEPPDIRNWFSSYAYESPELDTGDGFTMSVIQLDQQNTGNNQRIIQKGEKKEKLKEVRGNEFDINTKAGLADITECQGLHESDDVNVICFTKAGSISSEPPDIRNWFSSYVYESPAQFMEGELGDPLVKEILSGDFDESKVKSKGREANIDIKSSSGTSTKKSIHQNNVLADLWPSCNHSDNDSYQENCTAEGSDKNNDCSPNWSDQIVEETQAQCTIHSTSGICLEEIVANTDYPPPRNKTVPVINDLRCSRRLLHKYSYSDKHPGNESCSREEATPENPVSLVSKVVPLSIESGNNPNSFLETTVLEQVNSHTVEAGKENGQQDAAETGFISTKKNRRKIPNCDNPYFLQKHQRVTSDQELTRNTEKPHGIPMTCSSKRETMADVTNIQNTAVQEISGKWKCPQTSKSKLQPPMKQLRLEQWVTRA